MANMRMRARMAELLARDVDRSFRRVVWNLCRLDVFFWLDMFVYVHNPKKRVKQRPWITWDFQVPVIERIMGAIDQQKPLAIEKSRELGLSWILVLCFLHRAQFGHGDSYLLISRKEEYVDGDRGEDKKSLFAKLDYVLQREPSFLYSGVYRRSSMHVYFPARDTTIDGESTNRSAGRGDRRTACGYDEFAAVDKGHEVLSASASMTDCPIFISSPEGQGNAFYEQVELLRPQGRVLTVHWTEHPEKAEGLYADPTARNGVNPGLRSPWYDAECEKYHPCIIASQYDINYLGSDYQFFENDVLGRVLADDVRPPMAEGDLVDGRFVARAAGPLKLWVPVDGDGQIAPGPGYCTGSDIGEGTGASNSVTAIGDRRTMAKVGEYVSCKLGPESFGLVNLELLAWLNRGAAQQTLCAWEGNGPGATFGKTIIRGGYRNIWYKRQPNKIAAQETDTPGFWSTRETRRELLSEMRMRMRSAEYRERSFETVEECRQYVFARNGWIAHSRSEVTIDLSGARDSHGDRVIATALMVMAMGSRLMDRQQKPAPARNSFAGRRMRWEERQREKSMVCASPGWR
jgi:hypothetical protein